MVDIVELIGRVRAVGANVMIDGGKLKIINAKKLPAGALDFIKQYGKQLAAFLEAEGEFEERAAIIEYDGGVPRPIADQLARLLLANTPHDVSPADWSWFVSKAADVVDRRAA